MSESAQFNRTREVPESKRPTCLRCRKPVDKLVISPNPKNPTGAIVKYECHGETVRQEIDATLANEEALASSTAFNDYTSGLMPGKVQEQS